MSIPTPSPGRKGGLSRRTCQPTARKPRTVPTNSPMTEPAVILKAFMDCHYFPFGRRDLQNEFMPKYTNINVKTAATTIFPNPASP